MSIDPATQIEPSKSNLNATIKRRTSDDAIPLTDDQLDYWNRVSTQSRRLRAGVVRIIGALDVCALRDSIEAIVWRHESLRTQIITQQGIPISQVVKKSADHCLELVDISNTPRNHVESVAKHLAREFLVRQIDLRTEPLFAARLVRISDSEHILTLGLDHMIGDGVSCGLLNRDIWTAYDQLSRKCPLALPSLPIQFPDYVSWYNETRSARLAKDEPHWSARACGARNIEIPFDHHLPKADCSASTIINIPFGKEISLSLRNVAQRERVLLPICLLCVYVLAMAHWCSQGDWRIFFVTHRRYGRAELQNMIGFLSTSFHLRINVSKSDTLLDVLKLSQSEFSLASIHQDHVPGLPAEINFAQVFNWGGLVTYSARWSLNQSRRPINGIRLQPFSVDLRDNYTFYPNFSDTPGGVVATIYYRPAAVSRKTIEKLGNNMRRIAKALCDSPSARFGDLHLQ